MVVLDHMLFFPPKNCPAYFPIKALFHSIITGMLSLQISHSRVSLGLKIFFVSDRSIFLFTFFEHSPTPIQIQKIINLKSEITDCFSTILINIHFTQLLYDFIIFFRFIVYDFN